MPDNRDINPHLTEQMTFERREGNGHRLFLCPCYGRGIHAGAYLYRSMPMAEAINWFDDTWLPPSSGIPWSTNPDYSRDNYLDVNSPVQLEVSVHDIMPRIKAAGAVPKFEGSGETWGVGPSAEIGRSGSGSSNEALVALWEEYKSTLPDELKNASKGNVRSNGKIFQNSIFRRMFKDKIWTARVTARLFPPE